MRRFVVALSLLAVLALPAAVLAHEGHAHKVMGTVTKFDGDKSKQIEVKTADGKTVSVLVNKDTKYLKGTAAAAAADVKVGAKVVVEVAGEGDPLTARVVRLGEAPGQGHEHKP